MFDAAGIVTAGATTIIAVDGNEHRLGISKKTGADITLNFNSGDVVDEAMKLTGGRGADSSTGAPGLQSTFESALRVLKPGGTLSSLGVYSSDLLVIQPTGRPCKSKSIRLICQAPSAGQPAPVAMLRPEFAVGDRFRILDPVDH